MESLKSPSRLQHPIPPFVNGTGKRVEGGDTINRIKKAVASKDGNSTLHTAIVVLVIAMVFAIVLQFAGYMTVAQTARDNVQRVLDSYSMEQAREIYESSIRNGESGGAVLNQDEITRQIMSELSLETMGGVLYNRNEDGRVVYTLSNLFITNLNDTSLRLQVRFDLTIPVVFAGRQSSTLNIPMAVKSNYTPKT